MSYQVLIVNPASGGGRAQSVLEELLRRATARGLQVVMTESGGHAEQVARAAAMEGAETVIAAGGDDTVREVIAGILHSDTALGVLPLGTFNNVAGSLDIPNDPLLALEVCCSGERILLDLGQLDDGTVFIESLSVGFAERVFARFPAEEPVGAWARRLKSAEVAMATLRDFRPQPITVDIDGYITTHCLMQLLVSNGPMYGPRLKMAPHARMNDGMLDIAILPAMEKLEFLAAFPLFVSGRYVEELAGVHYQKCRNVRISSEDPGFAARVDALVTRSLPITVRILPGVLPVKVPAVPSHVTMVRGRKTSRLIR